jgi:hypothetical protein
MQAGRASRPDHLFRRQAEGQQVDLPTELFVVRRIPGRADRQIAPRSAALAVAASTRKGTWRDQPGSQPRMPSRMVGQAASANARTAVAPRSARPSIGPGHEAAPRRRASRAAASAMIRGSSPGPAVQVDQDRLSTLGGERRGGQGQAG